MRKTEKRDVEVKYCDYCKEETEHLDNCAICKREMCNKGGGTVHSTYSIEVYRYRDEKRLIGRESQICNDCAKKTVACTIQELFDGMISKLPVLLKS